MSSSDYIQSDITSIREYAMVSKSDSVALSKPSKAILIEEDGAIKIHCPVTDAAVTIPNLAGGILHPIVTTQIYSTGTDTTSDILVAYA